jgi:hypothetical protein
VREEKGEGEGQKEKGGRGKKRGIAIERREDSKME